MNLKELQINEKYFYTKLDAKNSLMKYVAEPLYLSTSNYFCQI